MTLGRTTRCCSAFALAVVTTASLLAQTSTSGPPRLWPVRPAWSLPLNNVLTATPAFSGTVGYFPIEGDRLAAYDLEYGTLLWITHTRATSQPAIGEGLVFVTEPDAITAYAEETGAMVWRVPRAESLAIPLVWDNGWLVGATSGGTVLAFRARDGGLIWQRDIGGPVRGRAALAADRVYIPLEAGRIVALHVETGAQAWERRIGGMPSDILALDDRLYVGSTDNFFYCIDASTGEIRWRWATGADVVGMPIADEHRVYFVSYDNLLRALDRKTGAQRWKRALPLRPTRGVVRVGDALIVSGVSPTAPAYWVKDGTPAGEMTAGGELAAAPHVVSGAQLPTLTLVTRDLAQGTVLQALTRSFDPTTGPVAPLPNPVVPLPPAESPDAPRQK